jgi:hypothetical protein
MRICAACVNEAYLHNVVQTTGAKAVCSYCNNSGITITIEEMAELVEKAFEDHYCQTSNEPSSFQSRMLSNWEPGDPSFDFEPEGQPVAEVIQLAAGIDDAPAEHIREIIDEKTGHHAYLDGGESTFGEEDHYELASANDARWQTEWAAFEHSLRTEARYFSRAAAATLGSLFSGIDNLTTLTGAPFVVKAGPGQSITELHRARVFQSSKALEAALQQPEKELGPPPSRLASAGRMNARGISVFYGATDPNCALGEVRPPVGSSVLVGKFQINRDLRLLDLAALASVNSIGSVFDPDYIHRREKAAFLSKLTGQLTRAVMPDDEPFEYLVTQAVADFLATEAIPSFDGIVYPSVQSPLPGQFNVVLFHKASRVMDANRLGGASVDVNLGHQTEDGWEFDYSITETPPPTTSVVDYYHAAQVDNDPRIISLELASSALTVHRVTEVRVISAAHPVSRSTAPRRSF